VRGDVKTFAGFIHLGAAVTGFAEVIGFSAVTYIGKSCSVRDVGRGD
jgi:hypothetical protein